AADGELFVGFDRVVLEVLVAAVAVSDVTPVRVSLADAAAESQSHRGALDIERLVVLEHAQRLAHFEILGVGLDLFEEQREAERREKRACLFQIWPVSEIEDERLEPRR